MLIPNDPPKHLDFDHWAQLAEESPDTFESQRKELINEFIADSTSEESRTRLERLQWRIDAARDLAPNPMAACIKLNEMMWDSFAGEYGLAAMINNAEKYGDLKQNKADIVHFSPPRQ